MLDWATLMAGADALPLPKGLPGDLAWVNSSLVRTADRVSQTQIHQHGGRSASGSDSGTRRRTPTMPTSCGA